MIQMNKNILKEEIQWLLEAIQEQFGIIRGYEEKIPRIELDILMENIRKLYEKVQMLERSGDPFTFYEHKTLEVIREKYGKEALEEDLPGGELPGKDFTEKPGIPQKEKREPKKPETPAEADLFSDQGAGFTEKLKQAREKSLGPKVRSAAPESLKASISINEKFLFINELFDGNLRDYNENIETLNGFADLAAALDYLDLLRQKNLWDTQGNAFKRLKELLESKFK